MRALSDGRREKAPPLRRQLAELRRRVAAVEGELSVLDDELRRRRELSRVDSVLPRSAANNLPLDFMRSLGDAEVSAIRETVAARSFTSTRGL